MPVVQRARDGRHAQASEQLIAPQMKECAIDHNEAISTPAPA